MALSVIAVSSTVSPFLIDELLTDMFMTSAPRRLPASSNELWVRVEASKKRLIWVRPRSRDCFFSISRFSSTYLSARSSKALISCGGKHVDPQQVLVREDRCAGSAFGVH